MNSTETGWLIINIGHPNTGEEYIFEGSFRQTRRQCIASFIANTDHSWAFWRRKYKFRCVKAEQSIKTLNP